MTTYVGIVARRPIGRLCSRHTDASVVLLTLLAAIGGPPAALAQAPPSPPASAVAMELQVPLREGARLLNGFLVAKGTKVTAVQVTVRPPEAIVEAVKVYYQRAVLMVTGGGPFTASLVEPLMAGQVVEVQAFEGEDPVGPLCQYPVVPSGEWGRVRAYLAAGVVFSNEGDDFSRQDLSLSFTLDENWWQARDEHLLRRDGQVRKSSPVPRTTWGFKQLNTFFDTRLKSF